MLCVVCKRERAKEHDAYELNPSPCFECCAMAGPTPSPSERATLPGSVANDATHSVCYFAAQQDVMPNNWSVERWCIGPQLETVLRLGGCGEVPYCVRYYVVPCSRPQLERGWMVHA